MERVKARELTPEERAALLTFPESYRQEVDYHAMLKLVRSRSCVICIWFRCHYIEGYNPRPVKVSHCTLNCPHLNNSAVTKYMDELWSTTYVDTALWKGAHQRAIAFHVERYQKATA